jgi:hypothetical protein
MIKSAYSSSYYLNLWRQTELKIEQDMNLVAVKIAGNGNDKLEFYYDRIKGLQRLSNYYKKKYEDAYKLETGINKTERLKTFNNGL